jgi:quinol monooxygenase YgiN
VRVGRAAARAGIPAEAGLRGGPASAAALRCATPASATLAAPITGGTVMSDIVEWVLEMDVREGQADKVQPLIDEMVRATQADEPGALHYEYYGSDDGTKVTVVERYADSAAVMTHLGNFGAKFAERFLAAFAPTRFTVFGPASAEVRAALAGFGAQHMALRSGFHR